MEKIYADRADTAGATEAPPCQRGRTGGVTDGNEAVTHRWRRVSGRTGRLAGVDAGGGVFRADVRR